MLLVMVFVVLIVSVAMMFAILSSFIPFSNAYGNIVQYSSAYYAAISALERGNLAIRYAGPGFDGNSGWKYDRNNSAGHYNTGHSSDYWFEDFVSYGNAAQTTLYWDVVSRTTSIPKNGEGNVDPAFIENGAKYDFNALNYNKPELIPLGYVTDISTGNYYSGMGQYSVDSDYGGLSGTFRLNPYLYGKIRAGCQGANTNCMDLCYDSCPGSTNSMMDKWTPIVDWVIKGLYGVNNTEVSILPTDGSDVSSSYYVHTLRDSLIRKCNIAGMNDYGNGRLNCGNTPSRRITFGNNYAPTTTQTHLTELNVMSSQSKTLKELDGGTFNSIIKSLNSPYITLELINNLRTQGSGSSSRAHHLYPFLEYRIDVLSGAISDRYYTIKGEGKVGKYDVRLQVQKPTIKDSSLGNFTIIF